MDKKQSLKLVKKKVGAKPKPAEKKANKAITFYLNSQEHSKLIKAAEFSLDSVGVFSKKLVLRYLRDLDKPC